METVSFHDVFRLLPDAVCILGPSHRIEFSNRCFESSIVSMQRGANYVFEEDLVHPEDKEIFLAAISEVINGLSASCKSLRTLTSTQNNDFPIYRRYNWSMNAELGNGLIVLSGKLVTVVDGEEDVEGEFLDFFQHAPIALHWLSGTGHILWANDTELQVLGYTADEYIGQPVMKFCPDDEELVLEIFKQLGGGNTIRDVPVRFRTKSGAIKHLLIDSNVNWNNDGSFRHTRCFIRDDTGRKIRDAIVSAEKMTATKTAAAIDGCLRRVTNQIRKQLYSTQDHLHALAADYSEKTLRETEMKMERTMGSLDDLAFATMCENGLVIALKPVLLQLDSLIRIIFAKLASNRRDGQRVELDLRMNDVPNEVLADASLTRVLHHLLSNAIAYSPDVSTVVVEVSFLPTQGRRAGGRRVLRVTDGVQQRGIFTFHVTNAVTTEMDLEVVHASFQKYYSPRPSAGAGVGAGGAGTSSSSHGLGIGLNVAYNMVQMMGGTLECTSTPSESVFWFSLDLAFDSPGSAARQDSLSLPQPPFALTRRQVVSTEEGDSKWTTVQESKLAAHYVHEEQVEEKKDVLGDVTLDASHISCFDRRRRVLVVDDSTICQRVLVKVFARLGLDCDVASNGREAIEKLRPQPLVFDAVVMDLQMPIMDGITAIKQCRTDLHLTIPLIVLTSNTDDEFSERNVMSTGASAYLNKPASINAIKGVMKQFGLM